MRFQTQWLRRVVGVFTLTTTLFSIQTTNLLAQASLFDLTFKVGHGANGIVYGIVVQDDGKIVVGGDFTQIAGQACTNLARLNSDGQLDTSFPQGTDGAVYRLLKQPDGKILVGGAFTNLQGVARQRIGRLLTNGVADASFNAGAAVDEITFVSVLSLQADEKVLVGIVPPSGPISFLKRLLSTGQLDESFVQTNIFWGHFGYLFAMCPQSNGSVLMGGGFYKVNDHFTSGLALIASNGVIDTSFVSPVELPHSGSSAVHSVMKLSDDSILLGGKFLQSGSTNRYAVAKLTASLAWDTSFQPDVFDPIHGDDQIGLVRSAVAQPDGKFVLGGNFQEVGGYWRRNIARLNSQGKVDPCFDPGVGLGDFGGFSVAVLARQDNDKILIGGNFLAPTSGGSITSYASSNLTRFLPQNECGVTRVHLGKVGLDQNFVAATCAPGGTNHLQVSTNLIDWVDVELPTTLPYVYHHIGDDLSIVPPSGGFFRVKKEY